ncbi:hypothetical protein HK100_006233 [Physocladia obscura]|uniref:PNPLA domain-containing protein n=1 Tax=Physocladia obscura TaxID=109957 RepID=A0AAD5TC64_9FUNG|nr:hypothetical protein HK100_006233 [Physocladia obscura]
MLQKARIMRDIPQLVYLLRSGLLRNLGGVNEPQLYAHLYLKTKRLIEDYHNEASAITYAEVMNTGPSQQREMFVSDTRQSFGSTALVLHGGATFALYHFGVAKALFNNDLLPRIITGSSISALVAALICTHTDNDLPSIFDASAVKLEPFEKKGGGGYRRKLRRLLETGYILDAKVFAQVIEDNLGDSTFEEAFKKTKRILNITVNSKRKNEVPRLLNYLTAPTVLIRTAACASASSLGIFESTDLKAKMKDGTVVNWGSHNVKWTEANESHEW